MLRLGDYYSICALGNERMSWAQLGLYVADRHRVRVFPAEGIIKGVFWKAQAAVRRPGNSGVLPKKWYGRGWLANVEVFSGTGMSSMAYVYVLCKSRIG